MVGDYDYLFHLEVDNFPPPDILKTLLSFKKELKQGPVGAWYEAGVEEKRVPCLVGIKNLNLARAETFLLNKIQRDMFLDGSCKKIHAIGLGCILIPRHVLEKVKFRHDPNWPQCPDTWFFVDLHNKKIPCFVDTSTKIGHENRPWLIKKLYKNCMDKLGKVH